MSKYGHRTLNWFEAIVNKLGGEEAAESFLRGDLAVAAPQSQAHLTGLAAMLAEAGLMPGNVNSNINENNFPIVEARFTSAGAGLKGFGKTMTTAKAEEWMRSEGKERGTIEHGLAYLKANPDCLKDGPIVLLGSSWVDGHGNRSVACLYEDVGEPCLSLYWDYPEREWDGLCRFLFVPAAGK